MNFRFRYRGCVGVTVVNIIAGVPGVMVPLGEELWAHEGVDDCH